MAGDSGPRLYLHCRGNSARPVVQARAVAWVSGFGGCYAEGMDGFSGQARMGFGIPDEPDPDGGINPQLPGNFLLTRSPGCARWTSPSRGGRETRFAGAWPELRRAWRVSNYEPAGLPTGVTAPRFSWPANLRSGAPAGPNPRRLYGVSGRPALAGPADQAGTSSLSAGARVDKMDPCVGGKLLKDDPLQIELAQAEPGEGRG